MHRTLRRTSKISARQPNVVARRERARAELRGYPAFEAADATDARLTNHSV